MGRGSGVAVMVGNGLFFSDRKSGACGRWDDACFKEGFARKGNSPEAGVGCPRICSLPGWGGGSSGTGTLLVVSLN
jgi:hypothetical protein